MGGPAHLIRHVLLHPALAPGQIQLLAEHGRGVCEGPTSPEGAQAPGSSELAGRKMGCERGRREAGSWLVWAWPGCQQVHTCPGEAARQPCQAVLCAKHLCAQVSCRVTGCPLSQASCTCGGQGGCGGQERGGQRTCPAAKLCKGPAPPGGRAGMFVGKCPSSDATEPKGARCWAQGPVRSLIPPIT